MNHFANGSFHCNVVLNGRNQTNSCCATCAQNFSGALMEALYIFLYWASDLMCARFEKSFDGLKRRFSVDIVVMFVPCAAGVAAGLETALVFLLIRKKSPPS